MFCAFAAVARLVSEADSWSLGDREQLFGAAAGAASEWQLVISSDDEDDLRWLLLEAAGSDLLGADGGDMLLTLTQLFEELPFEELEKQLEVVEVMDSGDDGGEMCIVVGCPPAVKGEAGGSCKLLRDGRAAVDL